MLRRATVQSEKMSLLMRVTGRSVVTRLNNTRFTVHRIPEQKISFIWQNNPTQHHWRLGKVEKKKGGGVKTPLMEIPSRFFLFFFLHLPLLNVQYENISLFVIRPRGKPGKTFVSSQDSPEDAGWCPTCRYNAAINSKIVIFNYSVQTK